MLRSAAVFSACEVAQRRAGRSGSGAKQWKMGGGWIMRRGGIVKAGDDEASGGGRRSLG